MAPKYFLTDFEREKKMYMLDLIRKENYKDENEDSDNEIEDELQTFKTIKEMKEYYKKFSIRIIRKNITLEF